MHCAGLQYAAGVNAPYRGAGRSHSRVRGASGSCNVESGEHVVEQYGLATSSCRVECFLQSVVQEVGGIEIEVGPKLAAQRADISQIQSHLGCEVARDRKREVLAGRSEVVRIEGIEKTRSIRHRNDVPRRLRQESWHDRYQARCGDEFLKTEIRIGGRDDIARGVAAAGRVADRGVEDESASASEELELVSAAYCRLALTEPRDLPGKANGRTKIV